MLYNRPLLFIHSVYNSLPLLTLDFHSFPPLPALLLGNLKSVLRVFPL